MSEYGKSMQRYPIIEIKGLTPSSNIQFAQHWNQLLDNVSLVKYSATPFQPPVKGTFVYSVSSDGVLELTASRKTVGWLTKEDGEYIFYAVFQQQLFKLVPTLSYLKKYKASAEWMMSYRGFSEEIYKTLLKNFAQAPRYNSTVHGSIGNYELVVRERLTALDFYIREAIQGENSQLINKRTATYIAKLNGLRDIHLRILECQQYIDESEGLIFNDLQGIAIEDRIIDGRTHQCLRYRIPNSLEKLYANELFEFVITAKQRYHDLKYDVSEFDKVINTEMFKPIRQLLNCLNNYDGTFNYRKAVVSIHTCNPRTIYDIANSCMKYYLMYRKKDLVYARYVSRRYINQQQVAQLLQEPYPCHI